MRVTARRFRSVGDRRKATLSRRWTQHYIFGSFQLQRPFTLANRSTGHLEVCSKSAHVRGFVARDGMCGQALNKRSVLRDCFLLRSRRASPPWRRWHLTGPRPVVNGRKGASRLSASGRFMPVAYRHRAEAHRGPHRAGFGQRTFDHAIGRTLDRPFDLRHRTFDTDGQSVVSQTGRQEGSCDERSLIGLHTTPMPSCNILNQAAFRPVFPVAPVVVKNALWMCVGMPHVIWSSASHHSRLSL
jgi:hypothetical protein